MTLIAFFKNVSSLLIKKKIRFALAGGFVASYYRKYPRATNGLDFLFYLEQDAVGEAEKILSHFSLKPHSLRKADLEGGPMFAIKKRSTPVMIIAGRAENEIGLDFLLPTFPWFQKALERAENNKIDFGFGPIPSLTVEDLIISKLYALNNQSTRFMDLDDLKSIFQFQENMNLAYLVSQLSLLDIKIPKQLQTFVPKALKALTQN
jgi:hypothetical protein